jgi:predicted dithiol-disulfide oxidoreductase (DUF899 family)
MEVNNNQERVYALYQEISQKKEEMYALMRSAPRFEIEDYKLLRRNGQPILLSELFGDKQEMILVHNMGAFCPYCTLWADGFNGIYKHLENRAAFVVATPDEPAAMDAFATKRGWKFNIVSTLGCSLKPDLGFQLKDGSYYPGVSTLLKDNNGKIYHIAKSFFGPGDDFCALWYLFDLLPIPNPDWEPHFSY